jgi:hypothetical protein
MVWRLAWIAMGLLACGPRVVDNTDDGSSTSASESSSSSPSSSEGESSVANESSSSGAPLLCEEFHDEGREGTPVVVRIANAGEQPIILDAPCFNHDYLLMLSDSGWYWPQGFCTATCQSQFVEGCSVCAGCASAAYTVLMPGGSVEVDWPGVLYENVVAPEGCFEQGSCGDECPRAHTEIPEIVRATVRASTYDACVDVETDPSMCTCIDTKALSCETEGHGVIATDLEQTTIYEPGSTYPILITFE